MRRIAVLATLALLAGCDADPTEPSLVAELTVTPAANTAPVVGIGADTTVLVGQPASVQVSFSDPDPDGPWEVFVDWGDGSFSGAVRPAPGTFTMQHGYAEEGSYEVVVTVSDDSASGSDAKWVHVVTQAPPVAVIASVTPQPAYEGATISFSSTGTSDLEGANLVYRWEWGDGAAAQSAARSTPYNQTHRYPDQGTYKAVLIVTDPTGLSDRDSVMVTTTNAAPTGVLFGPNSAVEGRTFNLGFSSVTDLGAADRSSLVVSINCGKTFRAYGTPLTGSCNAPLDQDTITIRSRVKDKDGAFREYSRVIPVFNAVPEPQLAATSPTTIAAGGSVSFSSSFLDYGPVDNPWTWRIVWGDGKATLWTASSTQGVLPAQTHAYTAAGSYNARLFVRDKDGAQGFSASVTVTVTP